MSAFNGSIDRFKGITIKSTEEANKVKSLDEFKLKLKSSLEEWMKEGFRGIWFHVSTTEADWIPVLVQNGFQFHHTKNGNLALLKWLPEDEECNVPDYAHHMIGVGGMVVNDKNEILAVQEKFRTSNHWKLPGGYVDPGEDLIEAAKREILEETGVPTEFDFIVCFRHAHGYGYDCSDLYFVVALKPLSQEINMDAIELSKCEWVPIREYINSPLVHDANKLFAEKFLNSKERGIGLQLETKKISFGSKIMEMMIYSPGDNK